MFSGVNYKGDNDTPAYHEADQFTMPDGEDRTFTAGKYSVRCEEECGNIYYTVFCNKGMKAESGHIDLWDLEEQSPAGLKDWAEELLFMWNEL